MGLVNWIRGKLCTNKSGHVRREVYDGITIIGYECEICGYRWYVKRSYPSKG